MDPLNVATGKIAYSLAFIASGLFAFVATGIVCFIREPRV
jgi:hypothetical protein